jgi:hypothetical protein
MTKMINVYVYDHWTHVISIRFHFNWFNAICGFNKKMHSFEGKYWWIQLFEMNDMMVKKTQGKKQVEQWFIEH